MTLSFASAALFCALYVVAAVATYRSLRRRFTEKGVANPVRLAAVFGAAWPSALMIGAIASFPRGEHALIRFVGGTE